MKKIILIFFGICFSFFTRAQDEFKVLIPELQGSYIGETKKGLAHGSGETSGIDHYMGEFKKGFPHGEGTYTWSDGQVYMGGWRKGIKEGYGKLTFKFEGQDSVIEGYFYKDKFLGDKKRPDPPYKVINSMSIVRYNFYKINNSDNRVVIKFESQSRVPVDVIIQESSGGYEFEGADRILFYDITFPFSLTINYKIYNATLAYILDCRFTFEINESGYWEVRLVN